MAKVATNQERLNELFDADPRNDIAIAQSLGVSKQTISAWRNGTRSPKRSMVKKIATYYNCSQEWLFGWDLPAPDWLSMRQHHEDEQIPENAEGQIDEIISLILQLSSEKRLEAARYIRYLSKSEENE